MANSSLEGSFWELTEPVKNNLNRIYNAYKGKENVEGYSRLEGLIQNNKCSYEQMKRIKNFFDSFGGGKNDTSYLLNGGTIMKNWVEECLSNARDSVNSKKKNMKNSGMNNQYQDEKLTSISKLTNNDVKVTENSVELRKIIKEGCIYEIEMFKKTLDIFNKNNKSIKQI